MDKERELKKELKKKDFVNTVIIVVFLISMFVNLFIIGLYKHKQTNFENRYGEIEFVRDTLETFYYYEIDDDEITKLIVQDMFESIGDAYSFYMDPVEFSHVKGLLKGKSTGIGIQVVDIGSELKIEYVYPNTSAHNTDIRRGDIITKINDTDVSSISGNPLSLIGNELGTDVKLEILRDNQIIIKEMKTQEINYDIMRSEIIEKDIGYIYIKEFTEKSSKEFKKHVDKLTKAKVKTIIVDVRDNPGGVLKECIKMTGYLGMDSYVGAKNHKSDEEANLKAKASNLDIQVVLLTNENSASASEVFAYIVKTNDKGTVVGKNTYGKGVGQSVVTNNKTGSGVIVTSIETVMSDGYLIHGRGVEPDIDVDSSSGIYIYTEDIDNDSQLTAALDYIRNTVK